MKNLEKKMRRTNNQPLTLILAGIVITSIYGCSAKEEPVTKASPSPGEKVVKANCKVCHAQGINGAPIIGSTKMWGPRLEKGMDALIANAISGVGLMPAKGGKTELSDTQIRSAVEYMVSQVADQ